MGVLRLIDRHEVPADLLEAALAVRDRAYAPYSHFRVGAALRSSDGRVFTGANIENASYGMSRCAEQSAVQAMASAGARALVEVVVVSDAPTPATPCGGCRQVLHEFGPHARVYLVSDASAAGCSVADLLPDAFSL